MYTAIWHGLYCGVLRIRSFACYKVDLYMHDMLTIQYYLDLENYAESTEKAKNYMMEQVVLCLSNNYFINIILNQPGYYQLRYARAVDVIK
ncbi:MAG TPA: hypothetical protein DD432_03385 [Eubacterium sp.]|nr:hypothetical protein [Eubacterium sp.]